MFLSCRRSIKLPSSPLRSFCQKTFQRFSGSKHSQQQLEYFKSRVDNLTKTPSDQKEKHKTQLIYRSFKPSMTLQQFNSKYGQLKTTLQKGKQQELVSGRISSIRKHGKTIFVDIRQEHIKLQLALKNSNKLEELLFRRGDIVGARGIPFVTKKGQLSLQIASEKDLEVLSPCLWMLPQYNSLKDPETRYRQKHLDLLTNYDSLQVLKTRSLIISALRRQLQAQGYLEVETPILSSSCGGAIAKPFETYHNDHKMNLYMRIAPQLYLKKLIIGGFSKVYEIGKNFRNESIDQTHNPEFSTCELYCAYSDYKEMMQFTQALLKKIVFAVNGSYKLTAKQILKGEVQTVGIDLAQPWQIFDFIPTLEKQAGIKLPLDLETEKARTQIESICKQKNVECDQPRTTARLLDKLCGKYIESKTLQPFFIINQPRILSPLAQLHPEDSRVVQRFELFINGWEIVNSYTELNSPFIQRQNTPQEQDFIEALQYGLPPTAGWGIGLDRLVMLITGKQRIQEVISFPLLRETPSSQEKLI